MWPDDSWIEAQNDYLAKHDKEVMGQLYDSASGKYKDVTIVQYIFNYISDISKVINPDPPIKPAAGITEKLLKLNPFGSAAAEFKVEEPIVKVNAFLTKSVVPIREFYVYRGVHIDEDSSAEKKAWFDAVQKSEYLTLLPNVPMSTTLDSHIAIKFAMGGNLEYENVKGSSSGLVIKIKIPAVSRGAFPIGWFAPRKEDAEEELEDNTDQEVLLPSTSRIRIERNTFRRTPLIYEFEGPDGANPLELKTSMCDKYDMLTVEATFEGTF